MPDLTTEQLTHLVRTAPDIERLKLIASYLHGTKTQRLKIDFKAFVRAFWGHVSTAPLIGGWWVDAICDHLQNLGQPGLKRLIISVPPRTGKSTLTSVLFPAWKFATRPETKFICASHSRNLSTRDSVYCRQVLESPLYQRHFSDSFALLPDQNQKTRFENDKHGYRLTTSTSSGIVGEGADVLILDDPNDPDRVTSLPFRQGVIDWYTQSASTRLNPQGLDCIVVCQQRCHDEDLTGFLLKGDTSKNWVQLVLPWHFDEKRRCTTLIFSDPRTTQGETLNTLYSDAQIEEKKSGNGLGRRGFSAQFQQLPVPQEGNIFKKEWFKFYREADDHYMLDATKIDKKWVRRFMTTDLAVAMKEQSDFTVAQVWGVTPHGHLLLISQYRDKIDAPTTTKTFKALAEQFNVESIWVEDVGYQKSVIQHLRKENLTVRPLIPGRADKVARSCKLQCKAEEGMVWLPKAKPYVDDLLLELMTFPQAAHDDQVDTAVWASIVSEKFPVSSLPVEKTPEDLEKEAADRYNRMLLAGL